jgi:hypothetical protein
MLRPAPIRAPALLALAVLGGLAAAYWGVRSSPEHSKVCMGGWDVPDLVEYLEGRGLRLHLSPTAAGRTASQNAYLTTAAIPGAEL